MRVLQTAGLLRGATSLVFILFAVDFADEFTSAFHVVSTPAIRTDLRLNYTQAGFLLLIGQLSGFLIEPWLFALSDRCSKQRLAVAAMCVLACAALLAAAVDCYSLMLLAAAMSGPAAGVAVMLTQAQLIDLNPHRKAETMARWTLMGTIGDFAGPLVVAGAASLGLSWRALFAAEAAIWLLYAWLIAARPLPVSAALDRTEDHTAPLHRVFSTALKNRVLLRWAVLLQLIVLLDEVLVAFGALYLRDALSLSAPAVSALLVVPMAGSIAGLAALERRLRCAHAARVLAESSCLTLAGMALFLLSGRALACLIPSLFLMGFGGAGLYPIMKAAAYDALPERSGTAIAVMGLFAPIGIALPALVGLLADRYGIAAAIAFTGVAPAAILLWTPRMQAGAARHDR